MWKRVKRILKMALLFPVMVVFAKGTYEDDPEPVLLETEYTEPAMQALEELTYGELPTLPGVDLPSYPTLPGVDLPSYPTLPSVNLPGATPEEQQLLTQGMGLIKELMSGEMPEAFKLGMDKIKNILAGEYNPLTSPYYKGLKEEAARFEKKGISDIRQRSQLGGMLYSEPAMGAEAEFRGILGTGLTKELGRLYEADVGRQAGMIPQLLGYAGLEQGRTGQALAGIGAMAPLAGKGGDIARQQAMLDWGVGTQQALGGFGVGTQQALFNQQIASQQALGGFGVGTQQALSDWQVGTEQAMLPYTVTAPLLAGLADYGNWYTPTQTYQPGLLDYALPLAGAWLR